ncbi:hypothetical protein Corgl_1685 [Coriobacterium glomerans PW2]|uniref:Uncharacterized protein n=1 Tax=Coriobacterium glomerans (strain ATCC 49209 / DSM 20642 / JCM 10262 / PW2) TaxID=700015 RepID=F2NB32_CORGP|nr:hypothetical protein [Coriobacterium glomerans]AEB07783.1 hypothetical protein Corgl_1685 [Coriobacterium glomerans PW2]
MNTEDYRQQYFIAARKLYHDARKVEWRILREKLKNELGDKLRDKSEDKPGDKPENKFAAKLKQAGYWVQTGNSGHGAKTYKSGSTLDVPYDLSNWRWITIKKGEEDALIVSLQAPDRDSNETKKNEPRNHHILEDRIAFIAPGTDGFDFCGKVTAEVTKFELPLSNKKANSLVNLVLKRLYESDDSLASSDAR